MRSKKSFIEILESRQLLSAGAQPGPASVAREWATYLGGGESDAVFDVAFDYVGNVLVTGFTDTPGLATSGAYQTNFGNPDQEDSQGDAFVAKISADGKSLLFFTYLGGDGQEKGTSIEVDAYGNIYVTGMTSSSGLATSGVYQPNLAEPGYTDAFVAKLDSTGGSLIYFSYFGGGYEGEFEPQVGIDSAGNAYLAAYTETSGLATPGAYQEGWASGGIPGEYGGIYDVIVAKFNADASDLFYATYIGGIGFEFPGEIIADDAGNAYLTGSTNTEGLATAGAFDTTWMPSFEGAADAFVASINPNGTDLNFFTYLGGPFSDGAGSIAFDPAGNLVIVGTTQSPNLATPGAYDTDEGYDGFVARLSRDGSQVSALTYLGGDTAQSQLEDRALQVVVDSNNDVIVSGSTTTPGLATPDAAESEFVGGAHYVAKFSADLSTLLYFSYITKTTTHGLAMDRFGGVVLGGYSTDADRATAGAYDTTYGGTGSGYFSYTGDGMINKFGNLGAKGAVVAGLVFNDVNANGARDSNDLGLAEVTVYLDTNANGALDPGEARTRTDANGLYYFDNLAPATYHVRQAVGGGSRATTPANGGNFDFDLTPGKALIGKNFGQTKSVVLSGFVFHDLDEDGIKDAGEPPLAGWRVFVDVNSNGILDAGEPNKLTDDSGAYRLAGAFWGFGSIWVELQDGWEASTEFGQFHGGYGVTGQVLAGINFGVRPV